MKYFQKLILPLMIIVVLWGCNSSNYEDNYIVLSDYTPIMSIKGKPYTFNWSHTGRFIMNAEQEIYFLDNIIGMKLLALEGFTGISDDHFFISNPQVAGTDGVIEFSSDYLNHFSELVVNGRVLSKIITYNKDHSKKYTVNPVNGDGMTKFKAGNGMCLGIPLIAFLRTFDLDWNVRMDDVNKQIIITIT